MAEQLFVVVRCVRTGRPMTGRFIKQGKRWNLAELHAREGSGITQTDDAAEHLKGNFNVARKFRGCPECGNRWFAQCDGCRELSCWPHARALGRFACVTCGQEDEVVVRPIVDLHVDDFG